MILIKILIFFLAHILQISAFGIEDPVYNVSRVSEPIEINAVWNKNPWNEIQPLTLDKKVGKTYEFIPKVQAKIAYDEEAIYVIFNVDDRYVKCITKEYQGSVYHDSCVEFFFTPGSDISNGYFNLEINCIGTALFKYHNTRDGSLVEIPFSEFSKVALEHSVPRLVRQEIKKPLTWTIEYRLPVRVIDKYVEVASLKPGQVWKVNFYKIAARTSNPQRLSWAKLPKSVSNFHRPEYFGTLIFR